MQEVKTLLAGILLLLSLVAISLSTVTSGFHAGQLSTPFVALISLFSSTISANSGWRAIWQFLAYFSVMEQSIALAFNSLGLGSTPFMIFGFIIVIVQIILLQIIFYWGLDQSTDKTSEPWSDHLRSFLTSGRVTAYRIILLGVLAVSSLVAFGLAIPVIADGSRAAHVIFAITSMIGLPVAVLIAIAGAYFLIQGHSPEVLEWVQMADIILLSYSAGLIGFSTGTSAWAGGNSDLNATCVIFLVLAVIAELLLGCLSQMTGMTTTSYETLPN